ncbi:MAG: SPFH domain-containing protein [Polyangiales bacterium]
MSMMLVMLFGVLLVAGPVVAGALGHPMGALPTSALTLTGVAVLIGCGVALMFTRLYVRTQASEAFVRTGMGGLRVIKDGGSLVVPVVHQVVRISLRTLRLEVSRQGADALITQDKLRADIKAEFYVRVMPDEESIQAAARSFGEHMNNAIYVSQLVEDKLVSALRQVAATKCLEELNTERDDFMKQVMRIITPDLKHNGLTLETATISKLDQTDPRNLRDDNIFDAQGKRTIAEITQRQLTERNRLEREGEQARTQQDVETRKRVLEMERERVEAEAAQQSEIAKARAEKDRDARERMIEAAREVALADVQKSRAVEVATREQEMAIEVAEREKEQAIAEAEQRVEVARRAQQQAIAEAERARVATEAALAKAEAERERERQSIKTVEVEAAAEREKRRKVIDAEAAAQQRYVEAQRAADAEAYRLEKEADGRRAAAAAEAEAVTRRAQAEADAARAMAEAHKAQQMVPVDVERERVGVKEREVEVLQQELEARARHGAAAQEFELAKMRITKEAEVRIEGAKAMAVLTGKINAQLFGTPEDVARMARSYAQGMGVAKVMDGFFAGADAQTLATGQRVIEELMSAVKSAPATVETDAAVTEVADAAE